MTEKKTLKRRVRARMEKTGERYTTARAHIAAAPEPEFDRRVSDEALVEKTGRLWDEWFAVLDAWGATTRTHTEIARHLRDELGVPGWWSQTVTVAYEQARGLRAKHERADGFSVSVSRTVAVPVDRLLGCFVDAEERERLVPGLSPRPTRVRQAARFDRPADGTRILTSFEAKGPAKSTVYVQVDRLGDADAAERAKVEWRSLLDHLKRRLEA